jgi:hypothetical protein
MTEEDPTLENMSLYDAVKKIADAEATKPRFYDSRVRKDDNNS